MKKVNILIEVLTCTLTLRCDIPVVLVKPQNYTADAWSQNTTILLYIHTADGGNS